MRGAHAWRSARLLSAALALLLCASTARALDLRVHDSPSDSLAELSSAKPLLPLFSKAYKRVHPDWHRGGAWRFHSDFHPCETFGQSCSLLPREAGRVRVRVNTTIIAHMGALRVDFEFREPGGEPEPDDTVAVYCVDEEEPTAATGSDGDRDLNFFDYVYVRDTAVEDRTRGSFVVGPLVNQRCSYQFRYLRLIEPLVYQQIGESEHVEMERGPTEPLQVRLAVTARADEMCVHWTSGRVVEPQVLYAATPHATASMHTFADKSETYMASELCDGLAQKQVASFYRHPGYMHEAVLTGLVPGQTYFFKAGSANGVWSREFSFRQPPAGGERVAEPWDALPQSFFVFGDLGGCVLEPAREPKDYQSFIEGVSMPSVSGNSMQLMIQDYERHHGSSANYLGVIHVGDLSYARGRTFQWDQFGAWIEPLASKLPYMVAIGNHEYDYLSGGEHDVSGAGGTNGWHPVGGNYGRDSGGECGVPTAKRFHMPDNGNGVFWYSFEMGLTHHSVISSEHNFTQGSPMYTWLVNDLNTVDRAKTPWLLLHLHRPLYCSQAYEPDYNVTLMLREALEPVLLQHRVDVVFSGHYHAYERTCAVKGGVCVDEGNEHGWSQAPIHVMIGSAGAVLDDAQYWDKPWSENVQNEYGYGRLHVWNRTHAQFEFVRVRGQQVSDSKWIRSSHDW